MGTQNAFCSFSKLPIQERDPVVLLLFKGLEPEQFRAWENTSLVLSRLTVVRRGTYDGYGRTSNDFSVQSRGAHRFLVHELCWSLGLQEHRDLTKERLVHLSPDMLAVSQEEGPEDGLQDGRNRLHALMRLCWLNHTTMLVPGENSQIAEQTRNTKEVLRWTKFRLRLAETLEDPHGIEN